MPIATLAAAAVVAAVGLATGCGAPTGSARPDRAEVVEVVDGDTIDVVLGGRHERVRLLGIDAPESVHPSVPVQCFGAEASAALADLLAPGTEVRVERDAQARDRYDRLLLYIYRADDDLFVNRWILTQGLADTAFYEPNTTLAAPLRQARSQAHASGVGLWGSCDGPDQPLDP